MHVASPPASLRVSSCFALPTLLPPSLPSQHPPLPCPCPPARTVNPHSLRPCPRGARSSRCTEIGTGVRGGVVNAARAGSDLLGRDPHLPDHPRTDFASHTRRQKCSPHPYAPSASGGSSITYGFVASPPFGTESTKPNAHAQKTDESLTTMAKLSATIGTKPPVARTSQVTTSTNVRDVGISCTELRNAVAHRRRHPLTPLVAPLARRIRNLKSSCKIQSNTLVHTKGCARRHPKNSQNLHPHEQAIY